MLFVSCQAKRLIFGEKRQQQEERNSSFLFIRLVTEQSCLAEVATLES